jgi:hypothetical protein
MQIPLIGFFLAASLSISAQAQTQSFTSSHNRIETCRILEPMPGAGYSEKDHKQERKLCAADFYAPSIALCPKTWSTSAAIVIYDVSELGLRVADYEASMCRKGGPGDKIGKLKVTMNQKGTSGTTSTASLLYYQFSRYLDTMVDVPVAVQRTVDKDVMYERVATHARGASAMNRTAWEWIKTAARNPDAYRPTDDLFTADRQQFYGTLLDDKGDRYGVEINSARRAGWGEPQVREFQTTPAFTALRTAAPLVEAIAGAPYPAPQMVYWMRELSEIAVLDHIFAQQDRVGNIDFQLKWYWVDEKGEVQDRKADTSAIDRDLVRDDIKRIPVPEDIQRFNPVLLQRSAIGDNDAAASPRYANFTKQTGMVAGLRHFDADQYRKLQVLARDFQNGGPMSQYLRSQFGLTEKQIGMIMANTIEVAETLKSGCVAGHIRFDLNPKRFLKGDAGAEAIDCSGKP